MPQRNELKYLLEEIRVFHRNLSKDNLERRKREDVAHRKLRKLDKFRNNYRHLVELFNKSNSDFKVKEEVKSYTVAIHKYLESIKDNLESRLVEIRTEQEEQSNADLKPINSDINSDTSDSDCSGEGVNMSEKFDLRTAAGLLPVMDGSENSTKQLIDAIELYDALLDAAGKKLLTTYVLKTRLSQSAKIRLNSTYVTNELLISDLKKHFITKKSVPYLSGQLNNAKQDGRSIEEFGRKIEELLVDLTITQAEGDENSIAILRGVNEKIAVNSFAKGLQNHDLRTIIKARNYNRLNEAIQGAKDEELPTSNAQVFHVRGRPKFRSGSGSRFFRNNNNYSNRSANHNRGDVSFANNNRQSPRNFNRTYGRSGYSRRGNFSRHNQQRGYFASDSIGHLKEDGTGSSHENQSHLSNRTEHFFRASK